MPEMTQEQFRAWKAKKDALHATNTTHSKVERAKFFKKKKRAGKNHSNAGHLNPSEIPVAQNF